MLTLYSMGGIFPPFVTLAIAVLATRGLTLWLGWRWYWQYIAAIVIWDIVYWGSEMLLNWIGQQLQP